MTGESAEEVVPVKTVGQHFVEGQQYLRGMTGQHVIGDPEVVVVIRMLRFSITALYVRLFPAKLTSWSNIDKASRSAVGLLCDDIQGVLLGRDAFLSPRCLSDDRRYRPRRCG